MPSETAGCAPCECEVQCLGLGVVLGEGKWRSRDVNKEMVGNTLVGVDLYHLI